MHTDTTGFVAHDTHNAPAARIETIAQGAQFRQWSGADAAEATYGSMERDGIESSGQMRWSGELLQRVEEVPHGRIGLVEFASQSRKLHRCVEIIQMLQFLHAPCVLARVLFSGDDPVKQLRV